MRRARIKAVATVPVRRKNVQDGANADSPKTIIPNEMNNEDGQKVKHLNVSEDPIPEKHIEKAPRISTPPPVQPLVQPEDPIIRNADAALLKVKKEESTIIPPANIKPELNNKTKSTEQAIEKPSNERFEIVPSKVKQLPIITETTIPPEPMSPTKILQNRSCFMRPIPRLDGGGRIRRNSIQGSGASASESEDDSKRSTSVVPNRVRNDSVCSVQSNKEVPSNAMTNSGNLATKPGQKRRIMVSESARKLAEARREFLLKHENKAPDRNKLTMYDLIYYNPVANPMKKQNENAPTSRRASICSSVEVQEEENVDEPTAMPVPQVKVGPDGQLIVDEQSLIIEHTNAKKNRDALANSEAVIDDGGNSNGFYKRKQKSKEWPKWETLKFYRALNTVGTDFLLMQSLFPKRTRQEIKAKFKKEERTNRRLVEKALMFHQEFDTETLEKELGLVASSIAESEDTDEAEVNEPALSADVENISLDELLRSEAFKSFCNQKRKKRVRSKRTRSIESTLDNLTNETNSIQDTDSDNEVYQIRPTRSGRLPKVRKLQAPDVNTLDTTILSDNIEEVNTIDIEPSKEQAILENSDATEKLVQEPTNDHPVSPVQPPEVIKNSLPDMSQVEPGSLVIFAQESMEEPENTIVQVYMVNPHVDPNDPNAKQNMTPVDLTPELLATVTSGIAKVEPISVKTE
ncbi:transcription factor TFIIIB component B'' homolog isoform X2 [Cephus cinctus]|uniref:Transcription factor TFIIIB component B'' homolog isoform X2 n=1 Tax=Cephus cinctus TaxID=211228 RepID=A0AAJ7R7W0_CEPCN|nr:transcription factor TFIIIB component B'' homolog isoform X2 [Cephus cinctus]